MSKFMRSRRVPLERSEPKTLDEELGIFFEDIEEAGQRLRAFREKKGWSESDLGNQVGLDSAHIAAMESGQQPIPDRFAKRFSEIFHTNSHTFL